jgi:hypothetical protein
MYLYVYKLVVKHHKLKNYQTPHINSVVKINQLIFKYSNT